MFVGGEEVVEGGSVEGARGVSGDRFASIFMAACLCIARNRLRGGDKNDTGLLDDADGIKKARDSSRGSVPVVFDQRTMQQIPER